VRAIRLIAIGVWGIPGAVLAAANRWPALSPLYPAGMAAAAAVSAAVVAVELGRLDGDHVYESCLKAITDHRRVEVAERRRRAKPPYLPPAVLPGGAADLAEDQAGPVHALNHVV
jgi:hypothetical protein